jgi:hypothetical protein
MKSAKMTRKRPLHEAGLNAIPQTNGGTKSRMGGSRSLSSHCVRAMYYVSPPTTEGREKSAASMRQLPKGPPQAGAPRRFVLGR